MAHHRSVMTNNNNAPDPPRGQSQRAAASSRPAARNSQPTAARRRPGHEGNHVEGARDCVTWQRAQWQRAAGTISKGRGHPLFSSNTPTSFQPMFQPSRAVHTSVQPSRSWPGRRPPPTRLRPARRAVPSARRHTKAVWKETPGEDGGVRLEPAAQCRGRLRCGGRLQRKGSDVGLRRRPSRQRSAALWRGRVCPSDVPLGCAPRVCPSGVPKEAPMAHRSARSGRRAS